MIRILLESPVTLREISQAVGISEKDVPDHLSHIQSSVQSDGLTLVIDSPTCLSCDFVFENRKRFTRPGRCPRCKSERIDDPLFHLE
jgi:predicted Zn-ribbon and HTH transcriptional regulator